jgi:hypothetical protein
MATTLSPTESYVSGVFSNQAIADAAVAELRLLGLTNDDILVVARAGAHRAAAQRVLMRYGARGVEVDDEVEDECASPDWDAYELVPGD